MYSLPDEILQFISSNVRSVEQLEILRVLSEDRQREWSPVELASAVQAAPDATGVHIAELHARGLIAALPGGSCRHGPEPAHVAILERVLDVYRERPVSMIRVMYERVADPLKSFADAFVVKKDSK